MQQAMDFLYEARALHRLIASRPAAFLEMPTQFKDWTVEQIVRHLHIWDGMADLSRHDETGFRTQMAVVGQGVRQGRTTQVEQDFLPLSGRPLVAAWQARYERMAADWATEDPKRRLIWAGPPMSARSSMTARIMEVWAHGQAVFDVAGVERKPTPRIWNVVALGVNTFGWSHNVQGLPVPETMPRLVLELCSERREWGDAAAGTISGPAEAFAQVVTQTRSVADTPLRIEGETARTWMETAQCFAGPRTPPPVKGARFRRDATAPSAG